MMYDWGRLYKLKKDIMVNPVAVVVAPLCSKICGKHDRFWFTDLNNMRRLLW